MIYAIPGESFQQSDPIEFLSGSNQTWHKFFCKPTKSYGDPGCRPTSGYTEFGWIRPDPTIGIRLNTIVWSDQPLLRASNRNSYCIKKIAFAPLIRSQDEYYDSRIRPSNCHMTKFRICPSQSRDLVLQNVVEKQNSDFAEANSKFEHVPIMIIIYIYSNNC
jgi:hypothetical protein